MKRIYAVRFLLVLSFIVTGCDRSAPVAAVPQAPPQTKPGTAGSIEVLFHPTDPTLPKIGSWLKDAKQTVDIAMYDLEVGEGSPVIKALMEPQIQTRLAEKDLSIRFIYEGYGTAEENKAKMSKLEALGADVRFVTSGKKVHHKFAVIDGSLPDARVITGSANWSLSSFRNYDENILFMQQVPEATSGFESEFETLWNHSTEFGISESHPARVVAPIAHPTDDLEMHFNSRRHLLKEDLPENNLTLQIVHQIESAKSELRIATTRVRLVPVLDALRAAGQRGVHVRILLSQDDYHDLRKRSAWLLDQPNIELRVKFYNLRPGNYMTYQMHNKFMIVDDEALVTGSFNWSASSENSHIENLVILKGALAATVLPKYTARFDMIWDRGRDQLPAFLEELSRDQASKIVPTCGFRPISLSSDEVEKMLNLAPHCAN